MRSLNIISIVLTAVSALRRFGVDVLQALWQSWKWILLQFLGCIFVDESLGFVGIRLYWGHDDILVEVSIVCFIVYTIIYCLYARFTPRSFWRKTFICPYLLYCLLVYLGILWHNDWRVSIVTVDSYMLYGWFAPLYGLVCWGAVRLIKRYLVSHNHTVTGKVLHVGWNVLACLILFVCLLTVTVLYFNQEEEVYDGLEVDTVEVYVGLEDDLTDTVYDDAPFQDWPACLNSVAGHDERDTIIGNFTGKGIDTLYVVSERKENPEYEEDAIDYWAVCSNPAVPKQRLWGYKDFQPKLVFEGDLDGNGKDEWGYLHTWLNSQWRTYRVFTLVGRKWRYLSDAWSVLSTPEYFRASGKEVVEPGPRKGTIKINYGTWGGEIEIRDTVIVPNYAAIKDDE